MRDSKYVLYALILLIGCSKSNDPSTSANTGNCLLTGITSGGNTPLNCTITYNSTNIVSVSCNNAGATTDTNRKYDYTYSNNAVSIKRTITDPSGSSSQSFDIILQNQLPIQLNINGQVSQKLFYINSKLLYYRTYRNNIDSVVFAYDAKNENIISSTGYTKSGGSSSWSVFSNPKYTLDSKTNPLNSIFLIEENFGDNTLGIQYFNKNNILNNGVSDIAYLYNSNNLPIQISRPNAVVKYYSYKCP